MIKFKFKYIFYFYIILKVILSKLNIFKQYIIIVKNRNIIIISNY
jgi:hypothetical protein